MTTIPRAPGGDQTMALLRDGYRFIGDRCHRLQTDAFQTRLMGRKAVCMTGADAARAFYAPGRFTRKGAMPPTAMLLLQDKESVAMLDGEEHHWRKRMFLSLMDPDQLALIGDQVEEIWTSRLDRWQAADRVVLLDEVQEVLCAAACAWVGAPLTEEELPRRTRELAEMIEGAGRFGPRNWRALVLRTRTERWAQKLIEDVRAHRLDVPDESALATLAWHRGPDDTQLDVKTAGVELINLLRPTVAVARFVVFSALALHEHPHWRDRVSADGAAGSADLDHFVQEVRRISPFFPFVAGRVVEPFEWRGHAFEEDDWVLLDLYGTNHDPQTWQDPTSFRPERFEARSVGRFDLVPQGGGDQETNHRCPGEWLTIELMKRCVRLLTTTMHYTVPDQDLTVDLSQMPAKPASGFVLGSVRPAEGRQLPGTSSPPRS